MLLNIHELHKWEKTSLGLMTFRERREGGDEDRGGGREGRRHVASVRGTGVGPPHGARAAVLMLQDQRPPLCHSHGPALAPRLWAGLWFGDGPLCVPLRSPAENIPVFCLHRDPQLRAWDAL